MRGGVCCHRGWTEASAPCSGLRDGVVVENAHAEVRTRARWAGCAVLRVDVAVETRDRRGRRDAIGTWDGSSDGGRAVCDVDGDGCVKLFRGLFEQKFGWLQRDFLH